MAYKKKEGNRHGSYAFGDKAKDLLPEQMYKSWADGGDCGMLEIKERESQECFSEKQR